MGWGRGGRGGRGSGGKGRSDRGSSPANEANEERSHYFEASSADEPSQEESRDSRLKHIKKKLEDIDVIEKRLKKGEMLTKIQVKKLEHKAQLEQELDDLTCSRDANEEAMIAELMKERKELELEMSGVEPDKKMIEAATHSWPSLPGIVPSSKDKGTQSSQLPCPTRGRLQLPGTKCKKLAPWARPSSRAASPAAVSPRSPRSPAGSCPPTSRNELRLPIPGHITEDQRALLEGDLPYWSEKFASSVKIEGDFIVAEFSDEAEGGAAKQELFELVEYDLELPKGALNSCNVSIKSPTKTSKKTGPNFGSLSDPAMVFHCCDTNGNGKLDLHELKFAFNAFGLFPSMEYLSAWMDERSTLTLDDFRELLDSKLRSAPTSMRGPRAVPYARRGVLMKQVEALYETFIASGWLQQQCADFNSQHQSQIRRREIFAMETNLYALNRWVIMPGTSPHPQLPIPEEMQRRAEMPTASHECSFSELMNSEGLAVDYFVSHFWGHPFEDTCAALRLWSSQVYWQIARPQPSGMVYWLCILALNQHRPGDEVGSSPEEGPFNAALVQSTCGAVMIVDEMVAPFSRIWCLFEVKRLTDLQKDFHLISAKGAMGSNLAETDSEQRSVLMRFTQKVATGLESVAAFQAKSSSEDDKYAIWHRVADPQLRKVPLQIARERGLFTANVFKRFDLTIRSLLAAPLYQTSLQEQDADGALRYLGMGAPFGESDVELLQNQWNINVKSVEVNIQNGTSMVRWQLLHVAAYFGHEDAVKALVERNANIEGQTKFKLTPLHQAARNGQVQICEMLLDYKANIHHMAVQGRTALQTAAHQGHRNVVELLLARKANPNMKDEKGVTALHSAALSGFGDMVEVLLSHGADPFIRQFDDLTALHVASQRGSLEVAREIVHKTPCSSQSMRRRLLRSTSSKGSVMDLAGTSEMKEFLLSMDA